MEKCEHCGMEIGIDCDGILTFGPDPFQSEINDNYEESWDCSGNRYLSAMEI